LYLIKTEPTCIVTGTNKVEVKILINVMDEFIDFIDNSDVKPPENYDYYKKLLHDLRVIKNSV